jgi:hypothetical protein
LVVDLFLTATVIGAAPEQELRINRGPGYPPDSVAAIEVPARSLVSTIAG